MDCSDATRIVAPADDDDRDRTVVLRGGPAAPRPAAAALALAGGTRLHEYRIERVLGQGGFGITYLATDVHLDAQVAIKEYLPESIAGRAADGRVTARGTRHLERYLRGLDSFLAEARTLAALRHPAIVRVARFFEANATAYMVLEYERGEALKTWWPKHRAQVGEAGLLERLLPVLDGLAAVHAAGFLHRDVKPENLQLRDDDGSLVLLDFGSAARVAAATDADTVVVTPGYAPIEQYRGGGEGPWTDLYALGATLYWCVSGQRVPDAEWRQRDPGCFVPAVEAGAAGGFGDAFLRAIDWALQVDPAQRPRDVAALRRALAADHLMSLRLHEALQRDDDRDAATGATGPARTAPGAARVGVPTPAARGATASQPARRDPAAADTAATPPRWRRLPAPRDWPLALKLALLLVATALLPMLAAGSWNLRGGSQALARAELDNVEQLARGTAARIGQFIDDARHTARGLAGDGSFAAFLARPEAAAAAQLQQRMKAMVRADPDLQLMILMDQQGQALVSNDPEVAGRNFAFRRYFREAAAGRPHVSGIVVGAVAGATGFFIAEPVTGADGAQLGVLVLRVLGSAVSRIVGELEQDPQLTPILVDGDGVVLHHPRRELLFSSLAPLSAQQQAEIKADQRFRVERVASIGETALAQTLLAARAPGHRSVAAASGEPIIVGYAPVPGHDWKVAVTESHHTFEAPMRALHEQLLLTMALVGAAGTLLALRLARGIAQPIRELTRAAHALKGGDFDAARVTVHGRDEVGALARTFNVMVDVLRQRERERKLRR